MAKVIKVKSQLLDDIVKAEVKAYVDGLRDPELRKNPNFLAKVRQFLKDNEYYTGMEVEGVQELVRKPEELPELWRHLEDAAQ